MQEAASEGSRIIIYSDWVGITSGVPQGSVLGPLLFIIFVNDLPDVVSSMLSIFADDTKLFNIVKSLQDQLVLQQDLDNLQAWSGQWQMLFILCPLDIHLDRSVIQWNLLIM